MSDSGNAHILLTPEQTRAADAWSIENGMSGLSLMEYAGKAVAGITAEYLGSPSEASGDVIVLCGPGNNGGDGYVAARYLSGWGYPVSLMTSCHTDALKGDAREMAGRWSGRQDPINTAKFKKASVIIDALFGTGLSRAIEGELAEVVAAVNKSPAITIAVDIPSGLCARTGQPLGPCVQADATITFFKKKVGQTVAPGRFLCGGQDHIHIADIGIPESSISALHVDTFENIPSLWGVAFPYAGPATHKYHRGHLLVLGGKEPTLGASRLAALAGLRVGAGLITLAAPAETYAVQATALTDVMVRRFEGPVGFMGIASDARIATVLMGPGAGVGEKTADLVLEVAGSGKNLVLDADALTSLMGKLHGLHSANDGADIILTPHDGEFERLFPDIELDHDRIAAARQAAASSGCYIVLKGVSTIVAAPDGRAAIATNAPAWLSVGGTGDILSGAIAGLLAQGMPAFEAASAGVWLQGEAAMRAGKGLIASDLLAMLPKVLP
ncbi:NAD(P)H-hydrate dehydratase [Kordiimonas sp.]|uniref:NAD(P)H-hydrate dehydratase n=1 Tax=Kordiimonas sp. TaxID=1970157 RepID=UPI003A957287